MRYHVPCMKHKNLKSGGSPFKIYNRYYCIYAVNNKFDQVT